MKCSNCQTPNPNNHNFCFNCGTLLVAHCPRCQFALSSKVNFCGNCGLALTPRAQFYWQQESHAPTGSAPVEATAYQFKEDEGQLETAGPAEGASEIPTPPSDLDQYLPRELRSKLEAARSQGRMTGERRIVTMLFCDVKGSTAAAGQLDPEEWTEIINGAFEYMIRPVYKYEGTVARLMGDGILVFFGAPIAHEDDPQRAVLVGLEIVAGLAPYREKIRQQWQIDLNVRVGINTGLVVVGAVGSDLRLEYTAMGDAINLAARMEQSAAPGTIQIAHETYKQVAHQFDIEALGEITVKGKSEPVPAYRVLGRKAIVSRKRGIEGLEADIVGRTQELDRLQSVLANLAGGVGRIVCLLGEAGLGKSRLIQELKKTLPEDNYLNWYEIGSLSYETGVPYALFQRLIRRINGISAGEEADQFWEKIRNQFSQIPGSDLSRYTRVFAALFGMADPSGQLPLEGEQFKRELYFVLQEIWQARLSVQPALIVFDDLHWADPASIELLLHLLPTIENNPVVLLCSFRPDRSTPSFQIRQTADAQYPYLYTEIKLHPLSTAQSNELVDRLLSIADLPESLRTRILERAAGNPFYVEEVVRTLIEKGAVVAEDRPENGTVRRYWRATSAGTELDIPHNLQGLLASRIDRLEERTRHVVQLASVIGRSFYRQVLTEISRPDNLTLESVENQISKLVRLEMIQEAARVPDMEYRFRNPMTQEIAYQTILLKRRREFHHRVAQALERLFPDQQAELAPRLAFHFAEAQMADKALAYYIKTGDNAFRLFALEEALHNYTKALELAELGQASNKWLIHLHRRRGRALELLLRYDEALATYRALETLGETRQDDALRLAGIAAQGIAHTVGKLDFENSLKYSERALALAREIGDRRIEARSLWSLALVKTWFDTQATLAYGQEGLAIARELVAGAQASNEDLELLGLILMDLTIPLIGSGQIVAAREYAVEAQQLFEQLENLPMASTASQRLGLAYKAEGKFDQSEKVFKKSAEIDISIGNDGGLLGSCLGMLDLYLFMGDFASFLARLEILKPVLVRREGLPTTMCELYPIAIYNQLGAAHKAQQLTEAVIQFRQSDTFVWPDTFLCHLARSHIQIGELETAQELLAGIRPGIDMANYLNPLALCAPLAKAELALAEGDWQGALAIVDEFLNKIRRDDVPIFFPETLLLKAHILCETGSQDEVYDLLQESCALALEQQAHPVIWRVTSFLAEIETKQGNQDEAQNLYRQARKAVDFIAEHAGRQDLRHSFLTMPQVQTILANSGGENGV